MKKLVSIPNERGQKMKEIDTMQLLNAIKIAQDESKKTQKEVIVKLSDYEIKKEEEVKKHDN